MSCDYDTFLGWAESRFSDVRVSGKEIKLNSCFVDDHKHHLWCCPDKGTFHCWKSDEGGTLVKLVAHVDGCSFSEAAERIGDNVGTSISQLEKRLQELQDGLLKPKEATKMVLPKNTFAIKSLGEDNHYRRLAETYIKGRKLPIGDLMVCIAGDFKDRIVIPYYGPKGDLIYWNSRDLTDKAYLRYRGPDKSSGVGKCFAKGTSILMFDGNTKAVEEIGEGDLLMGPDSRPRMAYGINCGHGKSFRVTPNKGDSFVVNEDHVLAVYYSRTKRYEKMTVREYFLKTETYKKSLMLYRLPVEYPAMPVPIDPYILGLWFGDGDSGRTVLTGVDDVLITEWQKEATKRGLSCRKDFYTGMGCPQYHITCGRKNGYNSLRNDLKSLGLLHNKHIPLLYLANDRPTRLALLAGYLDTDGSLNNGCFEFVSKHRCLAEGIKQLSLSLGYFCSLSACTKKSQTGYTGVYYRGIISGNTQEIPTRLIRKQAKKRKMKKDVLRTGFTVTNEGDGWYYGFAVDKDHLFLLADHTVVHNSDVLWFESWPKPKTKVYMTEGEFDAMSLNLTGLTAAACGGKAVSERQMELLKHCHVAISFDADKSGSGALNKLGEVFEKYADVQVTFVRPPTMYKDWNEMLKDAGPRVIRAYIEQNEKTFNGSWTANKLIFNSR